MGYGHGMAGVLALVMLAACGSDEGDSGGGTPEPSYDVQVVDATSETVVNEVRFTLVVTVVETGSTVRLPGRTVRAQATVGALETAVVTTDDAGLATLRWRAQFGTGGPGALRACAPATNGGTCAYEPLYP